jgi:deoxycytidine triphosphate deaminase
MSLLVDNAIDQLVGSTPTLATSVPTADYQTRSSKIQASSLDLTIGGIFLPGAGDDRPGGAYTPIGEHTLLQGHTAVIKTKEILDLPADLAGIAFPPASLSLKGLLTTNPGHIDPGYNGPLHLTVINMSSRPFPLRAGDRVIRVLLIRLDGNPSASFRDRYPAFRLDPITPHLLQGLSIDFLDVEQRAIKIASDAIRGAQLRAAAIATLIPIVIGFLAFVPPWLDNQWLKDKLQRLEDRMSVVETSLARLGFDERIKKLEDVLSKSR